MILMSQVWIPLWDRGSYPLNEIVQTKALMLQQMRHIKEPSLLSALSAKHRSKFAALSLVMVTAARDLKNCSGGYKHTTVRSHYNTWCRYKWVCFYSECILFDEMQQDCVCGQPQQSSVYTTFIGSAIQWSLVNPDSINPDASLSGRYFWEQTVWKSIKCDSFIRTLRLSGRFCWEPKCPD
jgi:hypothetical protein